MNPYDLLIQSAEKGNGRTLTFQQVLWVLQLIQNMDQALAAHAAEDEDIVEAEVVEDDKEQVCSGEGQDCEATGLDSPQQEEE